MPSILISKFQDYSKCRVDCSRDSHPNPFANRNENNVKSYERGMNLTRRWALKLTPDLKWELVHTINHKRLMNNCRLPQPPQYVPDFPWYPLSLQEPRQT